MDLVVERRQFVVRDDEVEDAYSNVYLTNRIDVATSKRTCFAH